MIGGCRERVTSCAGVLGADATERSVQREGHSLVRVSGVKLMSEVSGQRPERVKGRALWVLRAKP